MAIIHCDGDNFDKEVLQHKGVVIVDFFAPWCGPCQKVGPIFEALSEKDSKGVKYVKVNVDEQSDVAEDQGVQSIPTFVIFKDGKEVSRFMGYREESQLVEEINKFV